MVVARVDEIEERLVATQQHVARVDVGRRIVDRVGAYLHAAVTRPFRERDAVGVVDVDRGPRREARIEE